MNGNGDSPRPAGHHTAGTARSLHVTQWATCASRPEGPGGQRDKVPVQGRRTGGQRLIFPANPAALLPEVTRGKGNHEN